MSEELIERAIATYRASGIDECMDKAGELMRLLEQAGNEAGRLCHELDITNADHIALWLEANLPDGGLGWLACRIVEAHEAAARAAIAAVLAEMREPIGWQDIATFSDPTSLSSSNGVIVADSQGNVGEACCRNYGDSDDGWWWSNTSWGDYPAPERPILPLKGWQPLPSPPADTFGSPDA